jgi:hypothetical protein
MSIEEQIEHKKVQMIYLRKLLELDQEEIDVLNLQKSPLLEEPFAKERAAFKTGELIAWRCVRDGILLWKITLNPNWHTANEYKIVPDDEETMLTISKLFGRDSVRVKFIKSGLNGEETAEVLE